MDNKKPKSEANAAQAGKEATGGEDGQKSKADLRRERRAVQVFLSSLVFPKCFIGASSLNL
jgi:hypothetical protein